MSSMFGLVSVDDDGETAAGRGSHDDHKKKPKDSVINDIQADTLHKLLMQLDQGSILHLKGVLLDLYGVDNYSLLPLKSYETAKRSLTEKIEKLKNNKKIASEYAEEIA